VTNKPIDFAAMQLSEAQAKILDEEAPHRSRQKRRDAFAQVDLAWAGRAASAAGCQCAVILVLLQYLWWINDQKPFVFSNRLLQKVGIDRRSKYDVLRKLEAAGLVSVERRGRGRAPIVALRGLSSKLTGSVV
jgi:hypothetical protein